jgi:hypothetical protein
VQKGLSLLLLHTLRIYQTVQTVLVSRSYHIFSLAILKLKHFLLLCSVTEQACSSGNNLVLSGRRPFRPLAGKSVFPLRKHTPIRSPNIVVVIERKQPRFTCLTDELSQQRTSFKFEDCLQK